MTRTINQRLQQYELIFNRLNDNLSPDTHLQDTGMELLRNTHQLYFNLKLSSQKEYEASSLVYSMKRKMHKLYNKHLKRIKPVLNKYPKFWQLLEESEKNARAFTGWLSQMKEFYHLLINETKYSKALRENNIDLDELRKGQVLIQDIQQAYCQLQKCSSENKIITRRLKGSLKDLETINQNLTTPDRYAI